ncbi:MAG: adenine phosphoribosyltransferase [Dehalococcoidia bacterium]
MDLKRFIRDVPDFPEPGVVFKDITPLLQNVDAFRHAITRLADPFRDHQIETVVGIEARGFIVGAPLALELGAAFVPIRKKGKLPGVTAEIEYALEYGTATVEIHQDGVLPGKRVLIADDVLATGGTMVAARALVERLGGHIVSLVVLLELEDLGGRQRLGGVELLSLLQY